MKIAITGTLDGMERKDAIVLMATVGAEFSDNVTFKTNYLVATDLTSNKAKRAAKISVDVITQSEFFEFIEAGGFPENKLPTYVRPKPQFPEIPWVKLASSEQFETEILYCDAQGELKTYEIRVIANGVLPSKNGAADRHYFQAIDRTDGGAVKTFRRDRVVERAAAAA